MMNRQRSAFSVQRSAFSVQRSGWINHLLIVNVFFLLSAGHAFANNLNISNVSVASQDTSANTLTLQFDISWDNSWYDSINHDAAWVLIKYSTDGGTVWSHATMNGSGTNPTGFSTGAGTEVELKASVDKKVLARRTNLGTGSLSTTSVQVVWDYGTDVSRFRGQ
jgi:hypothetical protein